MIRHNLDSIGGIGPVYKAKLKAIGIGSTEELLLESFKPNGFATISKSSGLNEVRLKKWAGVADLFRIEGLSTQFSELLALCNIKSVEELAKENYKKLYRQMLMANEEKKVCRVSPGLHKIKNFIEQAKRLPKYSFY